ncbi:MAG TPA: hypothetical protein ENH05_00485 [Rhizobiales bacterium]|nr:hypothetical protein BMS3Bbin10_00266 [bacterium BMS3Bbin10]HDO51199.1 hypothetical protein [Hyphomicrobiales bacterium]
MSRIKLRNGDIALLGQLYQGPLELGDIPNDALERLTALGLARKVLGSCKITRTGQLTFHRQSFAKAPRRRVVQVTQRHPVFLQKQRWRRLFNWAHLSKFLKLRSARDTRMWRAARYSRGVTRSH